MAEINGVEVKRCPFCHNESPYIKRDEYETFVECGNDDCMAFGPGRLTTQEAIEAWNTRPWVKHLEHMIEVHMGVIDKLNARVKELDSDVERLLGLADAYSDITKAKELQAEVEKLHRYLDLMEVSEYYDDFECIHEWKAYESKYGEDNLMCELCGALSSSKPSAQAGSSECEHEWRTSPYDAGLALCRMCGIEHS